MPPSVKKLEPLATPSSIEARGTARSQQQYQLGPVGTNPSLSANKETKAPHAQDAWQEPFNGSRGGFPGESASLPPILTSAPSAHGETNYVGRQLHHNSTSLTSALPSPSLTNEPSPAAAPTHGDSSGRVASLIPDATLIPKLQPDALQSGPPVSASPNIHKQAVTVTGQPQETPQLLGQNRTNKSYVPPLQQMAQGAMAALLPAEPDRSRPRLAPKDGNAENVEHPRKRSRRDNGPISNSEDPRPPVDPLAHCCQILDQRIREFNNYQSLGSMVEKARYRILRDACGNGDLFYVVLHRFFCLWTRDKARVHAAFSIQSNYIDLAFNSLLIVLRNNQEMPNIHLVWFSDFPGFLTQIPGFDNIRMQISDFLLHFATKWMPLLNEIGVRKYPLLAWEPRVLLRCCSHTLESILFTLSRRGLGIDDGPLATELTNLFAKDQRKEYQMAERNASVQDVSISREDMVVLYKTLMGQALRREAQQAAASAATPPPQPTAVQPPPMNFLQAQPQPQQPQQQQQQQQSTAHPSPILQHPQFHAFHQQSRGSRPVEPQLPVNFYGQNQQTHRQGDEGTPGGPLDSRFVLRSNQPPADVPRLLQNTGQLMSSQGSPAMPNASIQLPSLRYQPLMANGIPQPYPAGMGLQPQQRYAPHVAGPHPQAFRRHATWGQPATSLPQSPDVSHPPGEWHIRNAGAQVQVQAQGQAQARVPVNIPPHMQAHLPSPTQLQFNAQASPLQAPRLPPSNQPTQQLVSTVQGRHTQSPAPASGQALSASPTQQQNQLFLPPVRQIQRCRSRQSHSHSQHTTHPVSENEYPSSSHDWTSVQSSLHLVSLRSPERVPSIAEGTRYYQFFEKFIVKPLAVTPQTGISILQFRLSPEELTNIPTTTNSLDELPISRYFNGCHRYRVRLCRGGRAFLLMKEAGQYPAVIGLSIFTYHSISSQNCSAEGGISITIYPLS
ncbi:hypothetical protein PT974_11553 [Cladobotryum mycophilum]|uniref:Uncharacterized protein n=1 Tax=Cladobotryum mycophilum TaxID=491253 RepID=A0ABR0S6X4_9HYPO